MSWLGAVFSFVFRVSFLAVRPFFHCFIFCYCPSDAALLLHKAFVRSLGSVLDMCVFVCVFFFVWGRFAVAGEWFVVVFSPFFPCCG